MSRFHAGVVERQIVAGGGGGGTLSPVHYNDDWTASLVAPPAGWSEGVGSMTYTATGAYANDIDGSPGTWNNDTLTALVRGMLAGTFIVAYNVVSWDNIGVDLQVNGLEGGIFAGFTVYHTTGDSGFLSMAFTTSWAGSDVDITSADPTGLVILAGVMEQDGGVAFYRFDDNGAVTVGTDVITAPTPLTEITAAVVMQNYDFSNDVPGTAGAIRIHHTYFGIDEELSLADITAIVTAWGWS